MNGPQAESNTVIIIARYLSVMMMTWNKCKHFTVDYKNVIRALQQQQQDNLNSVCR